MGKNIELLPRLPKEIIDAYEKNNLAIFVGAGISRLMGCMGWDEMANKLINAVCSPAMANQIISSSLSSKEKITIAKRMAEKEDKTAKFWEIFHEALLPKSEKDNIYSKISQIDTLFLTTNCDGLLVKEFPFSYTTDCTKEKYFSQTNESFVYCLHGDWGNGTEIDRDRLIFTEDKYLSEYQPGNELPDFLRQVMHDKTVLFIGYGLSEFEIINAAFEPVVPSSNTLKHYLLEGFFNYEQEMCDAKAEYFASINVNLIPYSKDECDYDQQAKIISSWIDELKHKTPYNSRGVQAILDALDEFSVKNQQIVKQRLKRTDSLKDSFLIAMLNELPKHQNCFEWIIFLFDSEIFVPEDIPAVNRTNDNSYSYVDWPILSCILACLKSREPSKTEKNRIIEFIRKAINKASEDNDIIKNDFNINRLWEIFITLEEIPKSDSEILLWNSWASESDLAISLIEREYCIKVIKVAKGDSAQLLCPFFAYGKDSNREHRSYWFPKLAQKISSSNDKITVSNILEFCILQFLETIQTDLFYKSFDDKYHFTKSGYSFSIYESIEIFSKSVDSDILEQVISDLLGRSNSINEWQFSLHLATKMKQGKIADFNCNPLLLSNLFVDFYLWLNMFLSTNQVSDQDINICIDWVQNASFGYDFDEEDDRFELSKKWANTWRYLLFDLLSQHNPNALELRDQIKEKERFDIKNPVEDKEEYYTVREIAHEENFVNIDFSNYSDEEIYIEISREKEKSLWSDEYYHVRELLETVVKKISDFQLSSFISFMLTKTGNELYAVASLLSDDAVMCRLSHDTHVTILKKLYSIICEFEVTKEERKQLVSSFVYALQHLSKNGWQHDEILNAILTFNPAILFVYDEPYRDDMDVIMNTINVSESQFYILAIDTAASCKTIGKESDIFISWLTDNVKNNQRQWLLYACAFRLQNLLFLDENVTKSIIMPLLTNAKDSAKVALAMCIGTSVIIPEVVNYCSSKVMINEIISLINKKDSNYRNADFLITYLVAAYYFKYLDLNLYQYFIQSLDENAMNHVAWTICEGINDISENECYKLIEKTLGILNESDSKAQYAKGIITYLSRKKELSENDWKIINSLMDFALKKSGLWHCFEDCLEKTSSKNDYIISTTEKFTKYSDTIYDFNADNIIRELAKLNDFTSIKCLAGYLVGRGISPEKFSRYGVHPELAKELLQD